ncbi:eCIS core domain-containing protein [Agromyces sp. M3QZ16-3]|uniref:eCIS core domain-containing protein n=1 Tax=Agromyces sp. M3QZ16-3 TaxID=3447585 RepID=UPI003F690C08
MHAHDWDPAEPAAARKPEAARDAAAVTAAAGLAARRTDAIGAAGLLRLQRDAGNGAVSDLVEEGRSPVHDVISSGGASLEPGLRTDMEQRIGADFGDVKVHTDAPAHESARSVNAHAYTVGSHVVFQRDAYDPSTTAGRTTIAHELTHVVQQRSGPVDGSPAGGGINVSDPGDRFERAAADNAARVMSEPAPVQREADGSGSSSTVQREGEEEEEPVQGLFMQRQEAEEPEEEAAT